MQWISAAFLIGCCSLWWIEHLPSEASMLVNLVVLALLGIILVWRRNLNKHVLGLSLRIALLMALSSLYAQFIAHNRLQHRFPISEGKALVQMQGLVCSLVNKADNRQTFEFCPIRMVKGSVQPKKELRRIRVSDYVMEQDVRVGEWLEVVLQLKGVYANVNPNGFDVERHALLKNIDALGTQKSAKSLSPHTIDLLKASTDRRLLWETQRLESLQKTANYFSSSPNIGWHMALLFGEKRWLSEAQTERLLKSGTAHLMAISGLHIGLVFFWSLVVTRFLWSLSTRLTNTISATKISYVAGIIFATLFALNAGLPVSTQRALIALGVFCFARLSLVKWSHSQLLSITVIGVLLVDPLAVLSEAFWLSFAAVTLIFLIINQEQTFTFSSWLKLQLLLSLGMSVFAGLVFGETSVNAVISNLIGIPLVTWVVLPLELLWLILSFGFSQFPLIGELGLMVVALLDLIISIFNALLEQLNRYLDVVYLEFSTAVFFLALLVLSIIAVRFRIRMVHQSVMLAALLLMLSISLADTKEQLSILFFDVGQGLSVFGEANTNKTTYRFLYDTGFGIATGSDNSPHLEPKTSGHQALDEANNSSRHQEYSFSVASSTVIPSLQSRGVDRLDLAILSHNNRDHVGGRYAIFEAFAVDQTAYGEALDEYNIDQQNCDGKRRIAENLEFRWFSANLKKQLDVNDDQIRHPEFIGNNASCLLLIEAFGRRIFLTGDIEKPAELYILQQESEVFPVDVLLVPHHGSGTSSSWSFIAQSNPKYAIISAGKLNAFDHPKADIVARYETIETEVYNTAVLGAIELVVAVDGTMSWRFWRQERNHFWRQR